MKTLTIAVPDDASPAAVFLAVASALGAKVAPSAASSDALEFPYLDQAANHLFKTREEYDDYWARVAAQDPRDGVAGGQDTLLLGAVDVRELGTADLVQVGVFIDELLPRPDLIGPTSAMHKISSFFEPGGVNDDGTGQTPAPAGLSALNVSIAVQLAVIQDTMAPNFDSPVYKLVLRARAG